ncbi:MAG: carbohydrate-binding domain-containing protein [Prevotella sp.]|nr:carbohydrate-binding domain-containing protein [Prevotella sp.]
MIRRDKSLFIVAMATLVAASCSTSDDWDDIFGNGNSGGSSSSTSAGSNATTCGDLATFTIEVDSTSLSETDLVEADNEDYLENNTFGSTVYITYNGSTASYSGEVEGVSITVEGADVVVTSTAKGVNYVLSGSTSDGMFKMNDRDNDRKFQLTLDGVSIRNADGPAVNIQTGKRCYVHLNEGTLNVLSDGTGYSDSDEDQKGTLFSEGELLFSGSGRLQVYANAKNGICSDDYIMFRPGNNIYVKSVASNCIKSNDGILIKGGVVNCETSATAAKGLKTDGYFQMDGGRVTAITTGNGEYDTDEADTKGAAGLKVDSTIVINGGELRCMSTGKGGKGISADQTIEINGGTVKVITSGTTYTYNRLSSKAKGIKADGDITFNGGTTQVRATGDSGSEGIESKAVITVSDGTVEAYSYDDAINSASHMYLKGGRIYAFAISNDGLDANGNLYVQGGTTVAYGTTQPECGIDANEERGYSVIVTGGTLVGIGGGTSYPSSASTQPSIVFGGSLSTGNYLTVNSGSTNIAALEMGRSYNGTACFLITSPLLQKGSAYNIYTGSTATGTSWHGLIVQPAISSTGTTAATVSSLSLPYSTCGSNTGGMGGGGMPKGGMPRW